MPRRSPQKIRVGHSPDADDAFMFYALAAGKILSDGFRIEHVIEDIESLNQRAFRTELEVTALSAHAYGYLSDRYQLLSYGASVGEGYGPVVIARSEGQKQSPEIASPAFQPPRKDIPSRIRGSRIAVPGRYTTAYLVLQLYEKDFEPLFTPFDQIFAALESGQADLGLLIHEGQLTYAGLGFRKILDLGEWWREKFQLPLPLGVNAIRRDLGEEAANSFSRLFLKSIEYAMAHREEAMNYALKFGRGLDARRGDQFVGMYVNEYALDLGEKGKRALELLFDLARKKGLLPA